MPAKKVANQLSRYDIPRLSRDNFSWVMRFQVWRFNSDQFPNYLVKHLGDLYFLPLDDVVRVVIFSILRHGTPNGFKQTFPLDYHEFGH